MLHGVIVFGINVKTMKAGTTFALMVGVALCVAGAILKAGGNVAAEAMMIGGLFVSVLAFAFRVLAKASAPRQGSTEEA